METKNDMNWTETIQAVVPVLVALAGSGAIVAYFTYKGNKPKLNAEAQKIHVDAEVSFAEGWKNLAEKFEGRVNKLEEDIGKLRKALDDQDEKYRGIIRQKDQEIYELQGRVDELELELRKYQHKDEKVELVKDKLHKDVDERLGILKKDE